MFKRVLKPFFLAGALLLGHGTYAFLIVLASFLPVYAFDPVTLATGAQAASNIMGGLDKVDEAADAGFAYAELLSEIGVETDSDEELEKAIRRLEDASSKSKDLVYLEGELKSNIEGDLSNAQKLSRRIKALRNSVRSAKQIAGIMGVRPKTGERAVKIQEVKISTMMLEELQSIRRAQYLAYLENREAKVRREMYLQEILNHKKQPRKFEGAL